MRKTLQEILFQPRAWEKTINAFSEQKNEILSFLKDHQKVKIMSSCIFKHA